MSLIAYVAACRLQSQDKKTTAFAGEDFILVKDLGMQI